MDFTLENMAEKHIGAVAELERQCFSQPWSANALREELCNENSRFLVAVGDEIAGYIGVQEICGEAYITNVAVFEKYRKKGIGRMLLKAAADGALSRNCEFITLEVRVSNSAAIALYESEGFEMVGVRRNFYASPVEDGAIYTKYFSGGISE